MVTIDNTSPTTLAMDAPDPIDSDIANKIVFYQYTD
jgi:hypothetical protein